MMIKTATRDAPSDRDERDRFVWQVPTRVTFGRGTRHELGIETAARGSSPAVVIDAGISSDGRVTEMVRSLTVHNVPATSLAFVDTNPTLRTVVEASLAIAEAGSDTVIAIGGGSTMDSAKLAALMVTNPHLRDPQLWESRALLDLDEHRAVDLRPGLPTLMVPTTAATGSELNSVAALSHGERRRLLVSGRLAPTSAVLDPELLTTVPTTALLEGGVETLVRLISPFLADSAALDVTDALTLSLASQCLQDLETISLAEEAASPVLAELMWTVGMSATQLFGVGRGRWSHVLWYLQDAVCSLLTIPKGQAIAALLPAYLGEIRADTELGRRMGSPARLAQVETALAPILTPEPGLSLEEALARRFADWGLSHNLSQLVTSASELDGFARHCYDGWHDEGRLQGVDLEELTDFFQRAGTGVVPQSR